MRLNHPVVLLVSLALVVASAPTPAHAGGVVSVCDEASLLAALADGGMVTFSCSGTIILTTTITIAADTTIDGSGQTVTISGNHAVRVFTVNGGVTLNLNQLTIANGSTTSNGGGILNNGILNISNSVFTGNGALSGGGIYSDGGTVTVSNSSFYANSASSRGGGISNGGMLTVSNGTFSGNSSYYGGGIANDVWGRVTVSNCTFSGNTALYPGTGGGISNSGVVNVSNSTFSGNRGYYGGGIFNSQGTVTVNNSTFSGNTTAGGMGGAIGNLAAATLKNTIVANSPAGGNCAGAITDGGGNLSYPDTSCPGINSDPVLGPLQNNGDSTQTMALLPGSAALDAANDAICAAAPVNNLDQRGIARPQGAHCDIGAFEAKLPPRAYLPLIAR